MNILRLDKLRFCSLLSNVFLKTATRHGYEDKNVTMKCSNDSQALCAGVRCIIRTHHLIFAWYPLCELLYYREQWKRGNVKSGPGFNQRTKLLMMLERPGILPLRLSGAG